MFVRCLGAAAVLAIMAPLSHAQLNRGFEKVAVVNIPTMEVTRQPDLWMMEVHLKPMRMVFVDIEDPQTGEKKQEQVWYLSWKSIVRPVDHRESEDNQPVNFVDPPPGPMKFIPEFTLITYDDPTAQVPAQILQDEILPGAMVELRKVERAPHRNSVQVIQPVPEAVPLDAENPKWIYGAATWRGIDPETDFFKVILSGFSNGYEARAPEEGQQQIWRKVIVQHYSRPGDRFDPTDREFNFIGDPEWTFQPDAGSPVTSPDENVKGDASAESK